MQKFGLSARAYDRIIKLDPAPLPIWPVRDKLPPITLQKPSNTGVLTAKLGEAGYHTRLKISSNPSKWFL